MSFQPSPRIRVDWSVPVWGVLGLIVQAAGLVWFVATMSARVNDNIGRIDRMEARVTSLEATQADTKALLGRLDERTKAIYDRVGDRR